MKNTIAVIVFIMFLSLNGKCDFIDFWKVLYNHSVWKNLKQYDNCQLAIKADTVRMNDSITVNYSNDTPCTYCETALIVKDSSKHILIKAKGKGTHTPLSISVKDLIEIRKKTGNNIFIFSHYEKRREDYEIFLFSIRID